MIRLRTDKKRFTVSGDVKFIEICDEQGGLGSVICIYKNGHIEVAVPGTTTFQRYIDTYKSKVSVFIKR